MNNYERKYVQAIRACASDEQLANVVNKIYQDGYEDGANNQT